MSITYDDLYDEMVSAPASNIANMLTLPDEMQDAIKARGVDPCDVLISCREGAYEDLKEVLRPAFYLKAKELGLEV